MDEHRDRDAAPRLALPEAVRAELVEWARAERPREACGVLLGRVRDAEHAVEAAVRLANVDPDPTRRYEVDPGGFVAAAGEARAAGLEVVGVWHSHPEGPAEASETDRREACPRWSYAIVDARTGALASYRLRGDALVVEAVDTVPDSGETERGPGTKVGA